jgi:predicted dehydrogenase
LDERRVGAVLRFGEIECVVAWVDLPGIARYEQEFAFYAPNRRLTLRFPSPFLRNMPTELVIEEGEVGTPRSWRTSETTSYEEAFERELWSFHEHIVGGGSPASDLLDGVRDVALCQAIVRAASTGRPVSNPTSL